MAIKFCFFTTLFLSHSICTSLRFRAKWWKTFRFYFEFWFWAFTLFSYHFVRMRGIKCFWCELRTIRDLSKVNKNRCHSSKEAKVEQKEEEKNWEKSGKEIPKQKWKKRFKREKNEIKYNKTYHRRNFVLSLLFVSYGSTFFVVEKLKLHGMV